LIHQKNVDLYDPLVLIGTPETNQVLSSELLALENPGGMSQIATVKL
jgi:hypothetical protein